MHARTHTQELYNKRCLTTHMYVYMYIQAHTPDTRELQTVLFTKAQALFRPFWAIVSAVYPKEHTHTHTRTDTHSRTDAHTHTKAGTPLAQLNWLWTHTHAHTHTKEQYNKRCLTTHMYVYMYVQAHTPDTRELQTVLFTKAQALFQPFWAIVSAVYPKEHTHTHTRTDTHSRTDAHTHTKAGTPLAQLNWLWTHTHTHTHKGAV